MKKICTIKSNIKQPHKTSYETKAHRDIKRHKNVKFMHIILQAIYNGARIVIWLNLYRGTEFKCIFWRFFFLILCLISSLKL